MVTTSTLQNSNFLQATAFKIVIYRQRFANLEFFAQTVSHPSVSLSPTQLSYRKTDIFEPGDKLIYDDLQIDAIVDEDMHVYAEMLNWQSTLIDEPKASNLNRFSKRTEADAQEYDISVLILNNSNVATREIVYKAAFPTSLGTLQLATNAGSVEPLILPITLKYNTFSFK
jgi:hypothetical protein